MPGGKLTVQGPLLGAACSAGGTAGGKLTVWGEGRSVGALLGGSLQLRGWGHARLTCVPCVSHIPPPRPRVCPVSTPMSCPLVSRGGGTGAPDVPMLQHAQEGRGAHQVLPRLLLRVCADTLRVTPAQVPQVQRCLRRPRLPPRLHQLSPAWDPPLHGDLCLGPPMTSTMSASAEHPQTSTHFPLCLQQLTGPHGPPITSTSAAGTPVDCATPPDLPMASPTTAPTSTLAESPPQRYPPFDTSYRPICP